MGIDLFIYLVFIIFIVFIFIYIRVLNKDLEDRLNGVLKAIDENFKDMHEIKKRLETLKEIQLEQNRQVSLYVKQNYEPLIYNVIDDRMTKVNTVLRAIQENIKESRKNHEANDLNLDTNDERKQIMKLYGDGKSIEEISKILNKNPQEINLILKSL